MSKRRKDKDSQGIPNLNLILLRQAFRFREANQYRTPLLTNTEKERCKSWPSSFSGHLGQKPLDMALIRLWVACGHLPNDPANQTQHSKVCVGQATCSLACFDCCIYCETALKQEEPGNPKANQPNSPRHVDPVVFRLKGPKANQDLSCSQWEINPKTGSNRDSSRIGSQQPVL